MASGHLCKLHGVLTRLSYGTALRNGLTCMVSVRQKSNINTPNGPKCKVEIGVTSDEKTIVCYHPAVDVPYEFTQPIERPDPLTSPAETHDQVLKAHLSKEVLKHKKGPTVEELGKMFFTTKHRFYPVGQYHMRRIKKNTSKDR
ncbi:39S ribosomal protein L42, mitochondrial [Kryptolebias marmoratus]|uniref:Large ribosomal subunit protein mL42 n=1 Tax=Kryptolebias marmoratus TaxID=37003 RepID=A0A3Q3ANH2_KRYMA|nr:39S ribosomal protein L42, mitochondrial [Kryptolebias marmoratus]